MIYIYDDDNSKKLSLFNFIDSNIYILSSFRIREAETLTKFNKIFK